MDFETYQKRAKFTAIYEDKIFYPALGLAGEAGEVANKIKKIMRDKVVPDNIGAEIGDVLWYCAALATDLGLDLDKIAEGNLSKLENRKMRGVLKGSGDNR